jgi:hypothetical protein
MRAQEEIQMKKIIVVVRDGCVESVFTNGEGDFELEVVDFDDAFPSRDEQEAMEAYVDGLRLDMREI